MKVSLVLADREGVKWAQEKVALYHYLHKPVDVRCSVLDYHITLDDERVGCLIFGRPEAQRVNGWYGSVEDLMRPINDPKRCKFTRWQIINLARVWLDPSIQAGGKYYSPDYLPGYYNHERQWKSRTASFAIDLALHRVVYDYLVRFPPVWMEQPYKIREVLSYCDTRVHHGTLYRASNFHLVRTNDRGIETYAHPVRGLTKAEIAHIAECSANSKRCQRLRCEHLSQNAIQYYWIG